MTKGNDDAAKVVVSCRAFPETIDLLAHQTQVIANQTEDALSPTELAERCSDADALLSFMPDRVDAAFLDACPDLRIVACALKGYDNFDVDACTQRGVWVSIVPDLLTVPTAELAIGLMIGVGRHIGPADDSVRRGFNGWRPQFYGTGLSGATVGIIGMGAVGQAIATRLRAFGSVVLYSDTGTAPYDQSSDIWIRKVALPELARRSDFVVVAVPLTLETHHMVDDAFLAQMKDGAYLVNPARGSVVREDAVAAALESGRLAGYAADVFECEDWALQNRPWAVSASLLQHRDRTLLTPHIGSAVTDVRRAIERDAALNVLEALSGERPHGAINDLPPQQGVSAVSR